MKQCIRNTVAVASLILTGCASTPPEEPGDAIVLRAGESAFVSDDGTVVQGGAATAPREAIVPSDPAARAKLEADRAARQEEQRKQIEAENAERQAKRDEWLQQPQTKEYMQYLCSLPEGEKRDQELATAKSDYRIVAAPSEEYRAAALSLGFTPLDCAPTAAPEATNP